MTDAPAAVPDAATAATALSAAKNAGGGAFLAEYTRLSAAGSVISYEDRQLAAQLQSHRAGIDPATLTAPAPEPAPPNYFLSVPATMAVKEADRDAIATDAKALAGAANMNLEQGSEFARVLIRDIASLEQMPPAERAERTSALRHQAHQVFGDRLEGMAKVIDAYLAKIAPDNALVARWLQSGACASSEQISRLYWSAVKAGFGPKEGA